MKDKKKGVRGVGGELVLKSNVTRSWEWRNCIPADKLQGREYSFVYRSFDVLVKGL